MDTEQGRPKWSTPRIALVGGMVVFVVAAVVWSGAQQRASDERFRSMPAPAAVAPATPAAPAVAAGPLIVVGPGLYEVGTGPGQVAPGKYRTPGPDGTNPTGCFFGRWRTVEMNSDEGLGYDLSQGPTIMVVQPFDGAVKVGGCTFTRAD